MHTASSFTSSWLGSSPSRQSPSRNGVRTPVRDVARRATLDKESPSRKMVLEFSQMLIRSDEDFNSRLDLAAAENAKLHNEQLSKAALEHERVREGAERERQRLIQEYELERRKREEEQKREIERLEREKARLEAEARQRQVEAKQREEDAARRAAEQRKHIQEAEARLKAQKDQEEAARRQKAQQEDAERKAKEAAAAAERVRQQAPQQTAQIPQASQTTAPPVSTTQSATLKTADTTDVEKIHTRYLELHKRMKEFWKPFKKHSAQVGNPLKGPVGDLRRDMRKATGQINVQRENTKLVITKLRNILRQAKSAGGPTIDIRPFIISYPLPALSNESEAQYPAIEKFVIKQFDQEAASDDIRTIQEIGAVAASLFVDKEFIWNGVPLIDLLLAKYHRACPILFGISGHMNTKDGQARLGWVPISGSDPTVIEYNQRMQGLASGYAAMSLRHVAIPAIPMSEYWRAVSSICNTAPQNLYSGHFMVLKGLIRDFARRFITFYGAQAIGVLRKAAIVLPSRAPQRAADTASLVKVLPDVWKIPGIA